MSFEQLGIFPPNPITTRGVSTKLSAAKGKIVYANGKTVIMRDLNDPFLSLTYSDHVQNTTVARVAPSGYYCASADVVGTVKIWDIVGEDQVVKAEHRVISGRVNDLEWDGESKRIIAVGHGREKFGHAFMMDSGTSTGGISGHSKAINSVSIRHQRPFRAATAAEDGLIVFHQGVPFKFDKTIRTHTNFVQDVRYSPSGDHFASVGSDKKIFLYDGKTGDTLSEFPLHHGGSVMACSWSPDSKFLVTSSADCTVVIWDVEIQKPINTWKLDRIIEHQQLGNVWSGERDIVSLSHSGDLNVFDERVCDKPARVLSATQKAITTMVSSCKETFLAGNAQGCVWSYSPNSGTSEIMQGDRHSNLVSGLSKFPDGSKFISIGYDDRIREIQVDGGCSTQGFSSTSLPTASQPKSVSVASDGTIFISEIGAIEAFHSNQRVLHETLQFQPSAIAVSGTLVAVGGEDNKVHLSEWGNKSLKEVGVFEKNRGTVTALAFSPDGKLLAAGDSGGKIILFDVTENKLVTDRWCFHTSRINAIAWTADGRNCASASLDTHVYIWSVTNPAEYIEIKNAVPGGANAVCWYTSGRLAAAGADGVVRLWAVNSLA